MKALGIEIRKANSFENLYADVDRTLQKYSGSEVSFQTVAHSLQKMIRNDNHFSVCTIDSCAKVAAIVISVERRNIYSAIHCMNWGEMLPEFRQMVVAMVLDDFRSVLNPLQ